MTTDDRAKEKAKGENLASAAGTETTAADSSDALGRRLLIAGIGTLGTGAALTVAYPAVRFLAFPLRQPTVTGGGLAPAGHPDDFTDGAAVRVDLFSDRRDAWNRSPDVKVGSAWVVRNQGEFLAFSSVCPHLGCAVDYDADRGEFVCPCHKSAFAMDGTVKSGPSPRALDRLDVEHDGNLVQIRYQRFRQGVPTKEPV